MAWSNVLERLGRAVFESPFGASRITREAPELAEIRLTALETIKSCSHRVNGVLVFPADLIVIRLLGIPPPDATLFTSDFFLNYFTAELHQGLERSNYRFPRHLRVEFETSPRMPAPGERWITVRAETQPSEPVSAAASPNVCGILTVSEGEATPPKLLLDKPRVNIGRTTDTFHATAGPSRRNDLAFTGSSEVNASVSREHAHILRSSDGSEYRLINDRVYRGNENCGLWIVRDGVSQPVHRGPRGVLLRSGDEIHIGRALLRFSLLPSCDPQ